MTKAQYGLFGRPPRLFRAGSAGWLMLHHIRTRLRGKTKTNPIQSFVRNVFLLGVLVVLAMMLGGSISSALVVLDGDYEYTPYVVKAGILLSAFAISLLGSSLISAYAIFTDRDDLDLLLASPLPPQRILLARMMQSAYSGFFTTSLLGLIAYGHAIVTLDLRFLLIFPVLFSFMIFDLAISFVIARKLMLWFGLRRGRTISMVAGFTILILGVLAFQLNSMVGTPGGERLLAELFGKGFTQDLTQVMYPIGRLAFGQFLETFGLLTGALAAFIGVGSFFWGRFGADAAFMAGQAQHVAAPNKRRKFRFAKGIFTNTILKEWRSMLRDPFVLVQVATPLVSLIPMALGVWALQRTGLTMPIELLTAILGFLAVQFGGQIAGTLAWTAASIEEAGDLLLSSPADGAKLFWSKALATAIPSFVFLALAMGVATSSIPSAFLGLAIGSIGLACIGSVEFLRPRPARRAKMTQRPDRSIFSVILGIAFSLVWSIATALAIAGLGWWTLLPVAVGLLAMIFVWLTAPKSVVWLAKAPKVGAAGGPWKA